MTAILHDASGCCCADTCIVNGLSGFNVDEQTGAVCAASTICKCWPGLQQCPWRCAANFFIMSSMAMLKMVHSTQIRHANQQSVVSSYICKGHSLQCNAALQDNGCNYTMLGYLFIKRSVLFCANNMPCCAPT